MKRDFTPHTYRRLLQAAIDNGYFLTSYENYICNANKDDKILILRHDVDRSPENSLVTAFIEKELNSKASYYFRIVPASFDRDIIRRILNLEHEIGYHYEDLTLAKGNYEKAIRKFESNLRKFRTLYSVKTICMHGSPLYKWHNGDIWKKYSYKDYGIIGEPYFDIDFDTVLYLTDTGRRWNSPDFNIRDKVKSKFNYSFKTTEEIISIIRSNKLPNQIMLNTHPQRWNEDIFLWFKELICQNIKNIGKRYFK